MNSFILFRQQTHTTGRKAAATRRMQTAAVWIVIFIFALMPFSDGYTVYAEQCADDAEAQTAETQAMEEVSEPEQEAQTEEEEPSLEEKASEKPDVEEKESNASGSDSAEPQKEAEGDTSEEEGPVYISGEIFAEGDSYTVKAQFDENACIPEGTQLKVKEIAEDNDLYPFYEKASLLKAQKDSGSESSVRFARFYDISFVCEGEEITPKADVDISISYEKDQPVCTAGGNDGALQIMHFGSETFTDEYIKRQAKKYEQGKAGGEIPDTVSEKDSSFDISGGKLQEASFEAGSFSVYGIVYTVDFEYEGYEYSMPGGSDMLLSKLFEILHIKENVKDVTDVTFTDTSLIKVEKADGDWKLSSLAPFDTEELLTITMADKVIEIKVTDAQNNNTFLLYRANNSGEYFRTRLYSSRAGITPSQVSTAQTRIVSDGEIGWRPLDQVLADYYSEYAGPRYSVVSAQSGNTDLCAIGFGESRLTSIAHSSCGLYKTASGRTLGNGASSTYDVDITVNDNSIPVKIYVDGVLQESANVVAPAAGTYSPSEIAKMVNSNYGRYAVTSSTINGTSAASVTMSELTSTDLAGQTFQKAATTITVLLVGYNFQAFNHEYPKAYQWTYGNGSAVGNNTYTINLEKPICKIVDGNGTEHPFTTLNAAVNHARANGNGSPMSASNPVKIEMLADYEVPQSDIVTLNNSSDNIVITTAKTQSEAAAAGETYYFAPTFDAGTAAGDRLSTDSESTAILRRGSNYSYTLFAVSAGGASLRTQNIIFDGADITTNVGGSLIRATAGNLTIAGDTTMRNAITSGNGENGGAIHAKVPVLFTTETGEAIIFNNCQATDREGGVIETSGNKLTINNKGTLKATDCNAGYGGFICTDTLGELEINNSGSILVENCSSVTGGGAVWTGIFKIQNNTGDITFRNCSSSSGGAIKANRNDATIDTFVITNGAGGSVLFDTCTSANDGGAAYVTTGDSALTGGASSSIEFAHCTATKAGGAIWTNIYKTENNSGSISFTDCHARTVGGAINVEKDNGATDTFKIINTGNGTVSFSDCSVNDLGGAVYVKNGKCTVISDESPVTFEKCVCVNSFGGAIYQDAGDELTLTNVVFGKENDAAFGCTATLEGGCVYSNGLTASITDCEFHYGIAGEANQEVKSRGGAIFFAGNAKKNATLSISGCTFDHCSAQTSSGNVAWGNGGAVYIDGDAVLTIDDSEYKDCYAHRFGGAILYEKNAGKSIRISNTEFTRCYTEIRGGGAFSGDANKIAIESCTFRNCYDKSSSGGGAIQFHPDAQPGSGSTCSVTNSTFEGCYTANGNGGAICNVAGNSPLTLTNVDINGSGPSANAKKGSAVYTKSDLKVINGTMENCHASDASGGAVNVETGKKVEFEGSVVVYNNKGTGSLAGQQKNVVLDQDINTKIRTSSLGLEDDAHIGVYVIGNNAVPFTTHGKEGKPFATAADDSISGGLKNISNFTNDRKEALYGVSSGATGDKLIYWSRPICKIIDNNPSGGTQIGTGGTYEHLFTTLNAAVDYARNSFTNGTPMSTSNPVKIEMLLDYVVPEEDRVILDQSKDNIFLTTAKTQTVAQAANETFFFEPSFTAAQGRLSTDSAATAILARGWNGTNNIGTAGSEMTALFNLWDTGTMKTENVIFEGRSQGGTGTLTNFDGRALANRNGHLTIGGGTQFRNHVWNTDANGGAVFNRGNDLTVGEAGKDPVIFSNCYAKDSGGGAFYAENTPNLSVTNAVFESCRSGNAATGGGGAFYHSGTTLTVTDSTFGNAGDTSKACLSGTSGGYNGGAIITSASSVTVDNSSFYGAGASANTAANGGAIYTSSSAGSMTITDSVFKGFKVSSNGGAVYHYGTGDLTIERTTFGALNAGSEEKTDAELTKDDVDTSGICQAGSDGGAVWSRSKRNVTVTDTDFFGSKGVQHGGAIYLSERDAANRIMEFDGCAFIGCECTNNYGAAVCEEQTDGRTAKSESYTECVFIDLTVRRGGAALLIRPETLTIEDCTFTRCNETYADSGYGGAVYILNNVTADISETTFAGCRDLQLRGLGGAVYNSSSSSTTTLENVGIAGGSARQGGAVYSKGDLIIKQSGSGTSIINGCTASDTTGGAVNVGAGKSVTFEGNVVVDGNTGTGLLASQQKNVVLDQDSNTVIKTSQTGIGSGARIGIYVTGTIGNPSTEPFESHGSFGDDFGTYGSSANLDRFLNDRVDDHDGDRLTGEVDPSGVNLIRWKSELVPAPSGTKWDFLPYVLAFILGLAAYTMIRKKGDIEDNLLRS